MSIFDQILEQQKPEMDYLDDYVLCFYSARLKHNKRLYQQVVVDLNTGTVIGESFDPETDEQIVKDTFNLNVTITPR